MKINSFDEYLETYRKSVEEPEVFWEGIAGNFHWKKKWDKVLEWDFSKPEIKWFDGGMLNLSENCLDRHLALRGDQVALIWEPNDPSEASRKITYRELHANVSRFANVLLAQGIQRGDRVCIYLPMVPEAAVAMLACSRIGAIHSVVFAGFSAQSVSDRINDSKCRMVITADGVMRGDKPIHLKKIVDDALTSCPSVETCIVFNNRNWDISMIEARDRWWHDLVKDAAAENIPARMESESPLFILYTSGSTGKPKGVLHTTAGYMVYTAYTHLNVFQYREGDVYWCMADIGWITGHSYLVYGPLLNGATSLMFEGIPFYPDAGRFWDVVEKHRVNIFYTAPTAIRSLEAQGLEPLKGKDLSSLRVLGTVGEPINEEAWHWYHKNVGRERCPVVDTWWQTETGGIMITPLAGITRLKPGFATLPLPGVQPAIMDGKGKEQHGNGVEGNLCIKFPWPGMARTVYGDHERFRQTYFSAYDKMYFTGDGCRRDEDGYYRITGRVDDVINVSGHRIGTGEIEDAIDQHAQVVETAVVGFPHDIKGQGVYAFVICITAIEDEARLKDEIKKLVAERIGAFARPDKIQVVSGLPKTRSGKIMRRILRKIAEKDTANMGDTSTLLDPSVVETIMNGAL